jgi:hypothetical protein
MPAAEPAHTVAQKLPLEHAINSADAMSGNVTCTGDSAKTGGLRDLWSASELIVVRKTMGRTTGIVVACESRTED